LSSNDRTLLEAVEEIEGLSNGSWMEGSAKADREDEGGGVDMRSLCSAGRVADEFRGLDESGDEARNREEEDGPDLRRPEEW